ncbi:hypothetical protein B0H13DRAFT_2666014 [Mycena leptocephala]|nr:hypothetical protein B0H13DRAFT_2666014 [Mycena leptocephala]
MTTAYTLRSRLVAIEQRIAALESELALQRSRHVAVSNLLQAVIYPILTLPSEIAAQIFLSYLNSSDKRGPLLVASICQVWRAVALATPALWTNFDYYGQYPNVDKLLDFWLSNAGGLPVNIRIKLYPSSQDAVVAILARYSAQCRSLDLELSTASVLPAAGFSGAWSLETIKIVSVYDFGAEIVANTAFQDAPQLREARLRFSPGSISLPWSQLTHLEFDIISLQHCLRVLAETQNLLVLRVTLNEEPEDVHPSQVTLPNLHTLATANDPDFDLLRLLTLPALENLRLRNMGHSTVVTIFQSFIDNSRFSLRRLKIYYWDLQETMSILSHLSFLTHLTITSVLWTSEDISTFLGSLTQNPGFLPALESLSLEECQFQVKVHDLAMMLSARTKGSGAAIAKLLSFRLSFRSSFPGREVEATQMALWLPLEEVEVYTALNEIRDLRCRHGLRMEIVRAHRWISQHVDAHMVSDIEMQVEKPL